MPSPTETTPAPETGFDPLVFWIQHRSKIVALAVLFVAGLAVFGASEYFKTRKLDGARDLFANAKDADGYRKVMSEYAGTAAAGDAALMLAEVLRKEGKIEESSKVLREFTEKYPEHQLISGAWMSLAANLEATAGKEADALAMYQKVSTTYANSFSAPLALMAQARLLKAKGKTDEARRIYEQVTTQFPDNVVSQQAAVEMRALKK